MTISASFLPFFPLFEEEVIESFFGELGRRRLNDISMFYTLFVNSHALSLEYCLVCNSTLLRPRRLGKTAKLQV